jgi:alpha-galactosidase
MRIVVIGAGSHSFGRGMVADLLGTPELRGRGVHVVLVDEDAAALTVMTQLAERIAAHTRTDVTVEGTADRAAALPGADYVITAVARRRMPLWEQDFRVPLAHGFRHCLGENGGPGALFHALRSFGLIIPICRDIERLCPGALLLNFTNPEARVLHAICHLTRVKAVGLCHGVFGALQAISGYLQRPIDELDVVSAGMNHFYCVLRVRDKATGEDLLPDVLRMAVADTSPGALPLFRKLAEVFGVFTFPSDDHIGEYLSFGAEYGGVKWHYGQEVRPVPLRETAEERTLEQYAGGERPLDADVLRLSGEAAVPIICDIALDRGAQRPAVNVLNTAHYIANLPEHGVVEVPATVDASGIHPRHVGEIPEPFAAVIRTEFTIHQLLTEAYRTGSRRLLLQALLLDPTVDSIDAAGRLLDDMLDLQRDYLPTFA